jgi:hypothetical protein
MVHSSTFAVSTNGECLTCSGFSLDETVCLGSLEFIADCFGSLSLSPMGSHLDAIFVGTTHSRSPSLRAMIEDSIDKFYTTSSGEGSFDLSVSQRHDIGALPAPIATMPRSEDAPTMMMVPPRTLAPRPNTGLPLERRHTFWEGQQARVYAQQANAEREAAQ